MPAFMPYPNRGNRRSAYLVLPAVIGVQIVRNPAFHVVGQIEIGPGEGELIVNLLDGDTMIH